MDTKTKNQNNNLEPTCHEFLTPLLEADEAFIRDCAPAVQASNEHMAADVECDDSTCWMCNHTRPMPRVKTVLDQQAPLQPFCVTRSRMVCHVETALIRAPDAATALRVAKWYDDADRSFIETAQRWKWEPTDYAIVPVTDINDACRDQVVDHSLNVTQEVLDEAHAAFNDFHEISADDVECYDDSEYDPSKAGLFDSATPIRPPSINTTTFAIYVDDILTTGNRQVDCLDQLIADDIDIAPETVPVYLTTSEFEKAYATGIYDEDVFVGVHGNTGDRCSHAEMLDMCEHGVFNGVWIVLGQEVV